jgi:histidyl-tRNA synthetase
VARFRAPRGTRDLLPAQQARWQRFSDVARELARRYGLMPIETPLFEEAAVFERGVGDVTDIVEKELFRVVAGRGESEQERWALRPEPTAGIVRAYLQHGMQTWPQPVRLFTLGPMFRYDRPQAGRYRQFWQFDVEVIGDAGPAVDAELLELATRFFAEVGLPRPALLLNSIGDAACRPAYVAELAEYYRARADQLPAPERERLDRNALRLLDSKDARMVELNEGAPTITDRLCDPCARHFAGVLAHLSALGVEYELAPRLVRGLDYYTRTTFEFVPRHGGGQQSALGGGGRYDGLVELLGGRPTPGIGFGLGLDRIDATLGDPDTEHAPTAAPTAIVVGADPAATAARLRLASELRATGLAVRADLAERRLRAVARGVAREGAHFAVVVGDELDAGQVQLRDLQAGTQRLVNVSDLSRELQRAHASHRHGVGEGVQAPPPRP